MPLALTLSPSPHADFLRTHLKKILGRLKIKSAIWSITIVGDKQMRQLHKKTMNINTTTDVLTFDLRDAVPLPNQKSKIKHQTSQEGCPVELDTVICQDEARRRAKQFGHPIQHELLLYAIHSLLHVQGYDDATAEKSARMHAREDALLVAIGVGPVYTSHKMPAAKSTISIRNGLANHPRNQKSRIKNQKSPGGNP